MVGRLAARADSGGSSVLGRAVLAATLLVLPVPCAAAQGTADAGRSSDAAASVRGDAGVALDEAAADGDAPRAPSLEAQGAEVRSETEEASSEPTGMVLRTLIALLACLALAYLAGHPRVQELEEMLGISQVVAAGFPFFALGAIAHLPEVSVLPDEVLLELTPLLELGLGWIGLHAGLRFDVRVADRWPAGTGNLAGVLTFVPFTIIAVASGLLLYAMSIPASPGRLLRDAAIFGAAGCLAAPTATALLVSTGLSERAAHVVRTVAVVDEAVGVLLLALLGAFYRPPHAHAGWELPGLGWLFVTLGMGVALGALAYALLRIAKTPSESTALLLGTIALAAGIATVFSVSPIVICFVAGVVLTNLPGAHHETMRAPLARLERPIYLIFLLIAGALWRFDAWQGWVLLPVFVIARLIGRSLAARLARARGLLRETPGEEGTVERAFVAAPIGALSIAIVVNVQALYTDPAVPLMVTVVVGGALVSEILVQLSARVLRARRGLAEPSAPEEPAP